MISAVALAILVPATGNATTQTDSVTYVAAVGLSSPTGVNRPPWMGLPAIRVAPLGGFSAPAVASLTVKIEDEVSTTGGVPYTVCQSNGTHATGELCGDGAKDVEYSGQCSKVAAKTFTGFNTAPGAGKVTVYIFSANTTCAGTGTTGTLSVTYIPPAE